MTEQHRKWIQWGLLGAALILAVAGLFLPSVSARFAAVEERALERIGIFCITEDGVCVDAQNNRLDLDANNDTSIRASTDDTVDVEIGAADEFQFTAGKLTVGDASAGDDAIVWDGNAQDFYVALDDSADDLLIGLGSTVGTTPAIAIDENLDLTLCDATASDCDVTYDGNAQDFYIALDDSADDLLIGLGATVGTTPIISMDENQDVVFAQRVIVNGVEAADSAATNETLEVAFTSPADTTGTNTHNAIAVDLAVGNATGGTNTVRGLQVDAITDDPQVNTVAIGIGDEWNYAIDTTAPIVATAQTWFDDFLGDTVLSAYAEISGSDAQAVQAIVIEQFGVYQLTSGDAGTGTAADLEAVHLGLEWQADQGSLIYETRLHLDTATTTARVCAGFTDDTTTVENPFTISGVTITSTASDAVAFCYDTDATTDQWYALGVAGDTDATGNAITGIAPTADTYQVLRIEIDSGGADARFYIDGSLVITLTANVVTTTTAISPFVSVDSADTAASQVVDIDYIFVSADRD